MSDGWEDVTDPAELRKVMGAKGAAAAAAAPSATPQLTGDARNQALQKLAALKLLAEQANRSAQSFDQTQNGGGLMHSLSELAPSWFNDGNAKFDATVEGMTPLAKAAFRVPGSGSDSDKESAAFLGLLPGRYSSDAKNLERYKQMSAILRSSIDSQRQLLGMAPQRRMFGAKAAAPAPKSQVVDFNHLPE